jgi:hypothetical protein
MLYLVFVIPILLLIVSIALVVQLTFSGSLLSAVINTIYYCIFISIISNTGHPNSVKMKVSWHNEWKGILAFCVANLSITLLIAWLVTLFF